MLLINVWNAIVGCGWSWLQECAINAESIKYIEYGPLVSGAAWFNPVRHTISIKL